MSRIIMLDLDDNVDGEISDDNLPDVLSIRVPVGDTVEDRFYFYEDSIEEGEAHIYRRMPTPD